MLLARMALATSSGVSVGVESSREPTLTCQSFVAELLERRGTVLGRGVRAGL